MSRILIAEDSSTQALEIQFMLEDAGYEVEIAENGLKALEAIGRSAPDLVLTDLQMPEMDGLQLVEAVRKQYSLIPVILMTANGSEEIAAEALRKGASSYVPKRRLMRDLTDTLKTVLSVSGTGNRHQRVLDCWSKSESHFLLENDPSVVPPLIGHLSENLTRMKLCDETGLIRVKVALSEALSNAIYHGNLEVSSDLRERDDNAYDDLADVRRKIDPYKARRVHVIERETPSEVSYVIRDEGPGFDPTNLPDPTDPANLERASGRGVMLIRTFMDRVSFNPTGNEIAMVKQRDR